MLFLLRGDGTMTRLDSGRIFQGANNFTELGVIYPFPSVALSVGFTLPNGINTDYIPLSPPEMYTITDDETGKTKTFENLYYASTRIPGSVTQLSGKVGVNVMQTGAVNGGSNAVVGTSPSYTATFTVEYATLPSYSEPSDMNYEELVNLLTAYQGTIQGGITELRTRMSSAESNIAELQEQMTAAEGDLTTLKSDMSTAKSDIDELQGDMATVQDDVNSLSTRMSSAEKDIDDLQASATTAESDINSLKQRMNTAESDIASLQSDVSEAKSDISTLESGVSGLASSKQDKTDSTLETASKSVVGAINEIWTELTQGDGEHTRIDTLEAEVNVLDSRVSELEEKTEEPLMTDFTVDVSAATATKFYNDGNSSTIPLPSGGGGGGGAPITIFNFTASTWTQETDGTYTLSLSPANTGRTSSNYSATVDELVGTQYSTLAIAVQINTDGSLSVEGVVDAFAGRVVIIG